MKTKVEFKGLSFGEIKIEAMSVEAEYSIREVQAGIDIAKQLIKDAPAIFEDLYTAATVADELNDKLELREKFKALIQEKDTAVLKIIGQHIKQAKRV